MAATAIVVIIVGVRGGGGSSGSSSVNGVGMTMMSYTQYDLACVIKVQRVWRMSFRFRTTRLVISYIILKPDIGITTTTTTTSSSLLLRRNQLIGLR